MTQSNVPPPPFPPQPPNYPPGMPPPAPPYSGGGYPPAGYPPGGGYPPSGYPQGGYPLQPQHGNGFAVASLICSILGFCIVFIGGLLGILFGILGLRKASQPNTGGRGMAVAGIIIGFITLLTSLGLGSLGYYSFLQFHRLADLGQQYVRDLSAGNIDAALAQTQGMTRAEVEEQSKQLQGMGPYQGWQLTNGQSMQTSTAARRQGELEVSGTLHFANGSKPFKMTIVFKPADRKWYVTSASFE